MSIACLNPFIRYCAVHTYHSNATKKYSICYDCRLFFIHNATGTIEIENSIYHLSNGDAVYMPPGSRYRFQFENTDDFTIVVVDYDLTAQYAHIKDTLTTATEDDFDPEFILQYELPEELKQPIIKRLPQIYPLLAKCVESFLKRQSYYRDTSSAYIKLCLTEFLASEKAASPNLQLCEHVKEYIQNNFNDSTLSNNTIADKFGYHPYHLSRIIKENTSVSLHQYLIQYRIRIAKNLLLTTEYDMEQIAWKCGFCSAAYFIKMFRSHTGITPKKYRDCRYHTEL